MQVAIYEILVLESAFFHGKLSVYGRIGTQINSLCYNKGF